MENNSKVIVSLSGKSKVYHKIGCHHIDHMKMWNMMEITKGEAEASGYRICRCCNGMNHHMRTEDGVIDFYKRKRNMEFRYINGVLYVKTPIGCWKLVYTRGGQRIVLYHRNYGLSRLNFDKPQYDEYHRQQDVPHSDSIAHYLNYIYEHDRFKEAVRTGEKIIVYSSKKNKKRADKSMKKYEQKRVDYLFRMLEMQNAGYKQLSMC